MEALASRHQVKSMNLLDYGVKVYSTTVYLVHILSIGLFKISYTFAMPFSARELKAVRRVGFIFKQGC